MKYTIRIIVNIVYNFIKPVKYAINTYIWVFNLQYNFMLLNITHWVPAIRGKVKNLSSDVRVNYRYRYESASRVKKVINILIIGRIDVKNTNAYIQ